jgi:thiol-disulfide isomerase/thioredoxin
MFFLFYLFPKLGSAQGPELPLLNIGDSAPPLPIDKWLKGLPVDRFEKNMVYVVEFWATWCKPCIAEMPHLSAMARKYKNSTLFLGINIFENEAQASKKVKAFVENMGVKMDYSVGVGDSNFIAQNWFNATQVMGIPKTFIVDAAGRLAWIGHPSDLDKVLPDVLDKTWDLNNELTKRNLNRRLEYLDKEASFDLMAYRDDALKLNDRGKADSALLMISTIISKEPELKYAPFISYYTFTALLMTDPSKAYQYGKSVIVTRTYTDPPYHFIIGAIETDSKKHQFPAEIYQLGAESYLKLIEGFPYPENIDIADKYQKMAEWYWLANDRSNAISAQQQAIGRLKSKKDFSATKLAAYESRLKLYQKDF